MVKSAETDLFGETLSVRDSCPVPADPRSYKIVTIRLRQAEFESFAKQAHGLGLTHNLALRIAVRRIAGFLKIDSETRQLLRDVSGNMDEISSNISQIRRRAEETGTADLNKLKELRAAFSCEFSRLDDKLLTILNVSQRRMNGRAMLKEASNL